MPSQAHAVLVDLFRQSQSLTLDLLRTAGVEVRGWQPALVDSTRPVTSVDYHVDLAVCCELSVLSALAHGETDPTTLDAAITAIAPLEDAQRSRAYFDLLRYHVKGALDRALERLMATTEHKYLSDFARKYYDEGEAQGEAKGEARGEARGKASALLQILAARGLEVSDEARAQVLACQDLPRLDAWLARALTATSVAEVIAS
jgi:hypothetical protein